MLLKVEQILSQSDIMLNTSVKHELAEKIAEDMIQKGLVKFEITSNTNDDFGPFVKVKGTVRVYNPDD